MNSTCQQCKFWFENQNRNQQGECRRNPPQIAGLVPQQTIQGTQPMALTTFPTVQATQWCGEHSSGMVLQ